MRLFFLGWLIYLNIANSYSQNLISNGSFEENTDCCKYYGQIEAATGWSQLAGSADYFNICCENENFLGIPKNYVGWQEPKNGKAYSGLYLYLNDFSGRKGEDYLFREHIQTKLIEPLVKGKKYTVSAYISLAESSKFYTNKLSFCFSHDKNLRYKIPYSLLTCQNRATFQGTSVFRDSINWQKIEVEYVANGGEAYLTIGLFKEDMSKKEYKRALKKNIINEEGLYCYYYIDDVSVVRVDGKKEYSHEH